MEIKDIRTRGAFVEFLKEQKVIEIEDADVEEVADWFLAIQEARIILNEFMTKDLAHILLNGYDSIKENAERAHIIFWNTLWKEIDIAREEGDEDYVHENEPGVVEDIRSMLSDFFGTDF